MTRVMDDRGVNTVGQYFNQPDIADYLEHLCRRLPADAQILIAGGVLRFLTQRLDVETLGPLKRLMRVKQGKPLVKTIMQSLDRLFRHATYAAYLDS